jgi:tight adherence protein C
MSMLFSLAPALLAALAGIALLIGGIILIVSSIRIGREAIARRVDLVKPRQLVTAASEEAGPLEKAEAPASLRRLGLSERDQREVVRRTSMIGIPAVYASSAFIASRIGAGIFLALLLILALRYWGFSQAYAAVSYVAAVVGMAVGWLIPAMLIQMSATRRAKAVAATMPEALDLLVVCVDAGLSLENALVRVVNELRHSRPELAEELAITSADMQILPSRDEALRRLADRVELPSIRSVVTTLAQTLRYGTPLAQALRVIAGEMRADALIQLEERANQLPALLTVPMMLFIMPTIFLVVGGPAALQLIDALSRR